MTHPDIELLNTVYPAVPAVDLPKSGGGLARFVDAEEVLHISKTRATGDFDNLTTTGIYYTQNGMTANKPATNLYAYILVLGYDNVVTQIVFNNTNAVFVRNKSGMPPTWSAWSQL